MLKPFEKYCRHSHQNLCQGLHQGLCQGLHQGLCQGLHQGLCQGLHQGLCQDVGQPLAQGWLTVFTKAATQHTTQIHPNIVAVKLDISLGSLC
jgi:hypothetical protein